MTRVPSLIALALSASALLVAPASAQTEPGSFEYRVPLKGLVVGGEASPEAPAPDPVALLLRSATLESATVGQPYSFDFKSLLDLSGGNPTPPMSAVSWGASASLPSWLTLNPDTGVLSGTPTVKNEAGTDFEVIATHEDAEGRQVFTIVVNGVVLKVTQIATGGNHTCAVTTAGAAMCWGYNYRGEIGDGSTTDRATPTPVSGLGSGVSAIAAGGSTTCAITAEGAALCWGYNASGQLGDGTMTDRAIPAPVSGLGSGVASISTSGSHTCAVTTAGAALCWGNNVSGQLGDNTQTRRLTPVPVFGLDAGIASIVTGGNHTCALTTEGTALCWGLNSSGQLGDNTTTTRTTPVTVFSLDKGVSVISTFNSHTCAVTSEGAAKCWGFNGNAQLGDGTTANRRAPGVVAGLDSGVSAIAAGSSHTCALTTDGGAMCWGNNSYGKLGDGTTTTQVTPIAVSGLSSEVASIALGGSHSCAVTTVGAVKCWGRNSFGQLGDNSTTHRLTPVDVLQ